MQHLKDFSDGINRFTVRIYKNLAGLSEDGGESIEIIFTHIYITCPIYS